MSMPIATELASMVEAMMSPTSLTKVGAEQLLVLCRLMLAFTR